jgi:hypothetical protein
MPDKIRLAPLMHLELHPTNHALMAANDDRYGKINIPHKIVFCGKDIVEAEFQNDRVVKIVVRLPYRQGMSAIYACKLDGTLKTVWLNRDDDHHKTLDHSKYDKA